MEFVWEIKKYGQGIEDTDGDCETQETALTFTI